MIRLLIDIGNTSAKTCLSNGIDYTISKFDRGLGVEDIKKIEAQQDVEFVALSCVGGLDDNLLNYLRERFGDKFLEFSNRTKIPLINLYQTPKTLGSDRIIAAVAANKLFPLHNVLVIDLGSAITIDFVSYKGEFVGGNISPGVGLRFRSLNQFTSQLPLCDKSDSISLCGGNTNEAIELGVVNGILYELKGYIKDYSDQYDNLKIVFTGGDAKLFADKIKQNIYLDFELIFRGLNAIIDHNVEN